MTSDGDEGGSVTTDDAPSGVSDGPDASSGSGGGDATAATGDSGTSRADASVVSRADSGGGADGGGTPGPDASASLDASSAPDVATGADASMGSTCAASLPAGWSLAVFNTATDSCPTGFGEHITFGTPSVAAGACSCTCSVTGAGSCGDGSLAMLTNPGHGNDACSIAWFTATVNGSQCIPVPAAAQGALGNFQATALAASGGGGTCTSAAHANAGSLTEPTQRYCDVPAASADAVCNGSPPTGFSSCIVASGEVACPASTPFAHAFTVEDSAALSCGTCSACSVSTTCANPTLSVFANGTCAAPAAVSFAVNGACQANPVEQTVLSAQYSATATASCTAGSSTASVQLSGPHTICCR